MNKKLQFKSVILLVALLLGGVGYAWANEKTNVSTIKSKISANGNVTDNFSQTGTYNSAFWDIQVTWKSDASWQNVDNTKGNQIGSGNSPATKIVLTGSNISGTIKSVVVNTSGANGINASIGISVGTTSFKCNNAETASLTSTASNYTFTGSSSGNIVITWNNSSKKAIYIKSITVTFDDGNTLIQPTISFPNESYGVNMGDAFTAPTPTCNSDGTKTYSSDNEEVATVDPSTGTVTIKKTGSATITLSVAASSTYEAGTASYTLKVKGAIVDGVFDFSIEQDYGSNVEKSSVIEQSSTWTAGNVIMNASGRNCWYTDNKTFRIYRNNAEEGSASNAGKIVFSVPAGKVITKIVFTGSKLDEISSTDNKYSATEATKGIWEGVAETVTLSATYTESGAVQIETITVTYGNPPTVEKPESSVQTGSYETPQNVTLTCSTVGATIHYTIDGTEPTAESAVYTSPINVSTTTTIKAIAVTTEGSTSFIMEVTLTFPTLCDNIAALTAKTETEKYLVTLSNAVVTFVNGNYAYIKDNSGAVVYYKKGHGLTAGDVLNGTATVAYQLRNKNPQITDFSGVTSVKGTAPNPTTIAASEWSYTFNDVLSQYFKITGATITQTDSKYYVSLNNESFQLYKIGTAITELDLNKKYTIIGFPTLYNTTKELQIFDAPEVEEYVTLPFAFSGGRDAIASTPGLFEKGLDSDYGSSPLLKFDGTGDYILLKTNEAATILSFDIKGNTFSGGTFELQTSDDGENYTTKKTYTENDLASAKHETFSLNGNERYIKWIYKEKVNGNVGLGNIGVNSEIVTIPESKYTTFASTANLDFSGTGVTVCIAKAENGAAKLAAVRGNIAPANTGVILYAEEAGNYAGTIIESTDVSITDNDMVGVTTETAVPWTSGSKYNYILQGGVFKKATGDKLKAGKAYLSTDYQATSRELKIVVEGETTAIKAVETVADKNVYDLQGRKVAAPTKGLYIINGKKMIVK